MLMSIKVAKNKARLRVLKSKSYHDQKKNSFSAIRFNTIKKSF